MILRKLAWYREGGSEKHLRDIRGMPALIGADLDAATMTLWVTKLGLQPEWQRLLSSSPP